MAINKCYSSKLSGRGCKPRRHQLQSLQQLPRLYKLDFEKLVGDEQRWWKADLPSLQDVIEKAVDSRGYDGKHEPHQRRLAKQVYPKSKKALLAVQNDLQAANNFSTLHAVVDKALQDIDGVGALFVYDVADRIALYRGFTPTSVYLHAGTRTGANALVRSLSNQRRTLEIDELPAFLRSMSARDLENALCIYADDLLRLTAPRRRKLDGRVERPAMTKRVRPTCPASPPRR